MPEIAEVTWLVDTLNKHVKGAQILSTKVFQHNIVYPSATDAKAKSLEDAQSFLDTELAPVGTTPLQIAGVFRRGKYVIIDLQAPGHPEHKKTILSHLGFTGWWIPSWAAKASPETFIEGIYLSHTKIVVETDKGPLHFTDSRALAKIFVFPGLEATLNSRYLKDMGPDAHSPEGNTVLLKTLQKTGRRVRDVILDQRTACGIGNYLACEALNRAKLHGAERAKTLTQKQRMDLVKAVNEVINLALKEETNHWWRVFRRKETPDGNPVTRESWGRRGHYLAYAEQPKPEGWPGYAGTPQSSSEGDDSSEPLR